MELKPKILLGHVTHRRLVPRTKGFRYRVFLWACPLSRLRLLARGRVARVNRWALASLFERDHGPRDGSSLDAWARGVAARSGMRGVGEIVLVTMPRLWGYAFNPVTFYLCLDADGQLGGVICDVNNTFGEHHLYVCMHPDGRPLNADDEIVARKAFHVSPFLERSGSYRFRFAVDDSGMRITIDYRDGGGRLTLATALSGRLVPFSASGLVRALLGSPAVTAKVTAAIHWQAAKLYLKGVPYVAKPPQLSTRISGSVGMPSGEGGDVRELAR